MSDLLQIGSSQLSSRLILGSSGYPDLMILKECIEASETAMVTVGIRRIELSSGGANTFMGMLREADIKLLPNTAGCYTAKEAVLTAKLAREALSTNRIKLEVIGDDYSLYPDSEELLRAADELVRDGFEVYPYAPDDPVVCQKLQDLGCVCVMPLASPIGSGGGLANPKRFSLIRKKVSVPLIVDAGIGTASDACMAMELGADAVLLNTAIAKAGYPAVMARAMAEAVHSGRLACQAKRISVKDYAVASTEQSGRVNYYTLKN